MVKSADDGAGQWSLVPWDNLDELARLLALRSGTITVVSHQGYASKLIVNHDWIIPFDRMGVQQTIGIEIKRAEPPKVIIDFYLRKLASWVKRRIGAYGHIVVDVSNGRVWQTQCHSCDQRGKV